MPFTGKFLLTYILGKERQGNKGNGEEKKENCKREDSKLRMDGGKVWKWAGDLFFFLFFACHFLKPMKFVRVYQNGNFHWEKTFHDGKKLGKVISPSPLKNIPLTPLTGWLLKCSGYWHTYECFWSHISWHKTLNIYSLHRLHLGYFT